MIEFDLSARYQTSQFLAFLKTFLPDDYVQDEGPLDINFTAKFITSAKRLGRCPGLDLDVLEIHHASLHDARVGISKDAFQLLLDQSYCNRALVVFIPAEGAQWRLSLLQMDAEVSDHSSRIRRSYSNPRRYSFLLGEGAHVKTPQQFLFQKGKIHAHRENSKDLTEWDDLQNRFSVEVLTKEFYDKLYHWYQWAIEPSTGAYYPNNPETADDDRKDISSNMIRLIVRLLFVWFIKQKGLVPTAIFDTNELDNLLVDFDPQSATEGQYYNAILQNLFFATLNNEIGKRRFMSTEDCKSRSRAHGVKTLLRDNKKATWFRCPQSQIVELLHTVPYMNCGLFECLDKYKKTDIGFEDDILLDGFSSKDLRDGKTKRYKYRSFIPNCLFFAPEHQETVTVRDDKNKEKSIKIEVQGLIPLLSEYNFTIEENTPVDVQVSLDPELLGRVFENLLASYNPETGTSARKSTGSFYTPRPIVEYMVNESLVAHLKTKVSDGESLEDEFRKVISYKEDDFSLTDAQKKEAINAIYSCKVLDPACGSGAFPMGMLQQMVHVLGKLDPDNEEWMERVLDEALAKTKKTFKTAPNQAERLKKMMEIEADYDEDMLNPDYKRKLYIIQNCIYGVDIQPIAMMISKLRFFISLICEQKSVDFTRPENNYGINTLPNLETKFVSANTLLPADIKNYTGDWTDDPDLLQLKDDLLDIRARHFKAKSQETKAKNKDKDEAKRQEILDYIVRGSQKPNEELIADRKTKIEQYKQELSAYREKKQEKVSVALDLFGASEEKVVDMNAAKRNELMARIKACEAEIKREENKKCLPAFEAAVKQVTQWNPYDQNASSPFFDPEWMFGVEEGFDIVIGNPPYLRVQGIRKSDPQFADVLVSMYRSATGAFDLYACFTERALDMVAEDGFVNFIMPLKWTISSFGAGLRSVVSQYACASKIVNLGAMQVFSASTYSALQWFKKDSPSLLYYEKSDDVESTADLSNCLAGINTESFSLIPQRSLTDSEWILTNGHVMSVLNKLQQMPRTMGDIFDRMFCGLQTSKDDVYFLSDCQLQDGIVTGFSPELGFRVEIEEGLVKPLLKGDGVHRYDSIQTNRYVLFPYHIENDKAILYSEEEIAEQFPMGHYYLKMCEGSLRGRENGKLIHDPAWFKYIYPKSLNMFCKEKLVAPYTSYKSNFAYDVNGDFYITTKVYGYVKNDNVASSYKALLALLNSELMWFYVKSTGNVLRGGYFTYTTNYVSPFPMPSDSDINNVSCKLERLVDNIFNSRQKGNFVDTTSYEQQIDLITYKLYNLEYEDVLIVDPDTSITREEYESYNLDEDEQA